MLSIVTVSVEEDQQDQVVRAEGCSESPKGCAPCCDKRWEGLPSKQPTGPVARVKDLGLVR